MKITRNQFLKLISAAALTLTGCGIALACLGAASRWSEYANWAGVMFDGVVQGILCTGMSVYLNEVISHCGPGGCSPGK